MPVLRFKATQIGSSIEYGVLVAGVATSFEIADPHYISFSQVVELDGPCSPETTDPPHVELDDERYGAYGGTKSYEVQNQLLKVLFQPNLMPYSAVEVDLRDCAPAAISDLEQSLQRIFSASYGNQSTET
jgi:hypothetical protein